MKRLFYAIFTLFLLTACSSAEKSERKGDNALAIGEYYEAATQYKKAYQRTPNAQRDRRGLLAFKQADAFERFGYTARALGAYRSAERYKYNDSITKIRIATLCKMQGDYKSAEKTFRQHLDSFPNDSIALIGIASCIESQQLKEKKSLYTVKLDKFFNSNRSDYCPALLPDGGGQLFFTSNRNAAQGDELSNVTGQKCCDIFTAAKDEKGKWKPIEAIEGGMNTAYDEATPSFSPDGKTMYLTVCRTDPTYPRLAEIWSSARSDASWAKPQAVKITADTLSSYAHPAVSPDGQWLYFASDMLGGMGGMDLYRAQLSSHGIGAVENLGPDINTSDDECFPMFKPTGELYFSSDRMQGMGGLDFYVAKEDTINKTWSVEHLPYPMNSSGDDFGITFDGLHNRGYFSSTRTTGGRGWDKIFEFSYPEKLLSVKGWVYEQDGYELPAATVYMVGNDGTNQKFGVRSDGSFEQPLKPGVKYVFLATCKGFLNIPQTLQTEDVLEEKQHVLQFPLPSISSPVLVRNVFYAFDSAELDSASTTALDRLTEMLKENPNVTIELAAHCDWRGEALYNQNLSQRRAESVVKYLTHHGIEADRLTAVGYGEDKPKVVNKKLTETNKFLHTGDTLTYEYIMKLPAEEQEVCNALNRRTEFRVLRTTYGLFDKNGKLKPEAIEQLQKRVKKPVENDEIEALEEEEDYLVE